MSYFRPVVLLSGGADSAVLLAHCLNDRVVVDALAVFVNYGQRHHVERHSAELIATHFGVPLTTVDLAGFGAVIPGPLTDRRDVPHEPASMAKTVVPNRNAVLLAAAAGIAAAHDMTDVVTAVHAGDHTNYPDCRPEFISATNKATRLSCGVGVQAPFAHSTKADIVRLGTRLRVPFALTWSCYQGDPAGHCGRCGACVARTEAFDAAGVSDPVVYRDALLLESNLQPAGA